MPVYIVNNMTIHDRDEYKTYVRGFMPVFRKFDRTVLISFPSREAVDRWIRSPG